MNFPKDLLENARQLFGEMDQAYERSARQMGFECKGCRDNCCRTRFNHHTLLEYFYLRSGFTQLPAARRKRIWDRATEICRKAANGEKHDTTFRPMCPLNEEERCVLYAHRPMICRLHGVPHFLRRPDGRIQVGPGCSDFYIQSQVPDDRRLDRTPIYAAMAGLERRLRQRLGYGTKIKMTVAEMILHEIPERR